MRFLVLLLFLLSCATNKPTAPEVETYEIVELKELSIGDCFISMDKVTAFFDPDKGFIYEFKIKDEWGYNAYLVVDIFEPTEGYIPEKQLKVMKVDCSVFEKIKAQDPTYGNEYKMLMEQVK